MACLRTLQVENPIAFSDSPLERKLTAGYLHARYFGLLLAPVQVHLPVYMHLRIIVDGNQHAGLLMQPRQLLH